MNLNLNQLGRGRISAPSSEHAGSTKHVGSGPAFRLTAAALAIALLVASPLATAKKSQKDEKQWSEWEGLAEGYVGRQRVPPRLNLPVSERRAETTQPRRRGKAARRAARRAQGVSARQGSLLLGAEARASSSGRVEAAWLRTTSAGLHAVPVADLAETLGQNANGVRSKAREGNLSLSNAEHPTRNRIAETARYAVPWHFDKTTDTILFAARANDTFFTDENAFRMGTGRKKGRPMEVVAGTPTDAAGQDTPFGDLLRFEEEPDNNFTLWAIPSAPDADFWFWAYLWGGHQNATTVPLSVPNPAIEGVATLRVKLRGGTNLYPGIEHRVSARLNGIELGPDEAEWDLEWDGFEAAELVLRFEQALLDPDGDNSLTLYNDDTPDVIQWMDSITLAYERLPVAVDGTLWMHKVAGGTQRVTGFSTPDIVAVESPNRAAVLRQDVRIEQDSTGNWSVTLDTTRNKDYLIAERRVLGKPTLAPDYPSRLRARANRGNYLIVAPREFEETARDLADFQRGRFRHVKISWVDEIYDEFSGGRENPLAFARLMRRALAWRVPPSYVMIVGKSSLDHKDRMGLGDSYLPVLLTSTPWASAPSDSRLLGFEDDAPFSIGRLPITKDEEGQHYVYKLRTHNNSGPEGVELDAVLVADDPDNAGDFSANSDALAIQLEELSFDPRWIRKLYHPQDPLGEVLSQSETWLTRFVNYFGHGSITQVGPGNGDDYINVSMAEKLRNDTYPIFSAMTCASGDDTYPGYRSLAGALVLNPVGGVAAAVAPTGLSLDRDARVLNQAFVDNIFGNGATIGEALRTAKAQSIDNVADFMPRMYSVIGDPAAYAPPMP